MKKILFAIGLSILITGSLLAQNLTHKVVKGETLSAIATKYGTTVGDIMRYNGMNASSQLSIGQMVKIPPAATKAKAATTDTKPAAAANSNAREHVVQKSETLYAISKKYGVTIPQLQKWNGLTAAGIQVGQKLIVSDPSASVARNQSPKTEVTAKNPEPTPSDPTAKTQQTEAATSPQKSIKTTSIEVVPATTVTTDPAENSNEKISLSDIPAEGFFKNDFLRTANSASTQTVKGTGMVFKTTSGWNDRKYYILMNQAPVGSIVKISANNKTVYAKVLWKLEEMKLNEGLSFRLSDAAANALGINDNKFNLTVEF